MKNFIKNSTNKNLGTSTLETTLKIKGWDLLHLEKLFLKSTWIISWDTLPINTTLLICELGILTPILK